MNIRDFKNDFASSAFKVIDGDSAIVGKYGRIIQLENGVFDCWFVGPNLAPLGARRLASFRGNLAQEGTFREITGEVWVQGHGRDFVLRCALLARVRQKKRISAETVQRLVGQLAGYAEKTAKAGLNQQEEAV